MGFYEEISKYYDYIFPVGMSQIKFIQEALIAKPKAENSGDALAAIKKQNILDVACGSGGYAIELSKRGFNVTAIDLDDAMLELANKKILEEKAQVDILKCDLRELKETLTKENKYKYKYLEKESKDNNYSVDVEQAKMFDCIFCIGNSLVHLGSYTEILGVLKQMKDLLTQNGELILQIINYDRIIKLGIKELPTIKNEKNSLEFIRKYEFSNSSGLVSFNTVLTIGDNEDKETFENSIELYPVKSGEMLRLLFDSGFNEVEFYGDFDKTSFREDSFMLVVKACYRAK